MMERVYQHADQTISVSVSRFRGHSGTGEYHFIVRPMRYAPFGLQLEWVLAAYCDALARLQMGTPSAVWRRFFCSDLLNQAAALRACPLADPADMSDPCAVSWVSEPPAGQARISLWAHHIEGPGRNLQKTMDGHTLTLRRGELAHHWTTGLCAPGGSSSAEQTRRIFEAYDRLLTANGMTLADHVIRTWLFVSGIDANYAGLVRARREFFESRGLTAQTHYIASTGIEGAGPDPAAGVLMDAYAVSGVRPEQVEYLCAPDHMCPTSRYGVTFERGTALSWRDRRHLFISGTASIDCEGNIVHPGDIRRQFDRAFENIRALLATQKASLEDFGVLLVYVRDPADRPRVEQWMRQRMESIPFEVLLAPVCRPGWLVEAEGLAVIPCDCPDLPDF